MSLSLSSDDLARLETALETLLSPLSYARVDDWRTATREAVGSLLGADQSGSILPMPGEPFLNIHRDTLPGALAYERYYHTCDFVLTKRRKERRLEIYHRDMLYEPGEMNWDELYQDWCIPYRLHEPLGMGFQVDNGPFPAALHFYHDHATAPQFGERGVALLRLLLPAFKAGVVSCLRLAQHRADLERALDQLDEGLAFFSLDGGLLHANPTLARTLAVDPERDRLRGEMGQIVVWLCELGRRQRTKTSRFETPVAAIREVQTGSGRYRVRGSLLGSGVIAPNGVVLIGLETIRAKPASDNALQASFGLTRREVEVARLLGEGRTNAEIAQALAVSRHTAARHTEHVRMKLGVRSRAAVGAKLREGGGQPP